MRQDRAHVEDLKDFCAKERERIYARHQFGIGGREIVEEYTRLTDNVIQRIYHAATQGKILPESPHLAILALGGYGREELNPYSDIDIMLVYDAARVNVKQLQPFASELITILWDAGLKLGIAAGLLKNASAQLSTIYFQKRQCWMHDSSLGQGRFIANFECKHQSIFLKGGREIYCTENSRME